MTDSPVVAIIVNECNIPFRNAGACAEFFRAQGGDIERSRVQRGIDTGVITRIWNKYRQRTMEVLFDYLLQTEADEGKDPNDPQMEMEF